MNSAPSPPKADTPTTLLELAHQFPNDEACAAYLFSIRYPAGYICPNCGSTKAWKVDALYQMKCENGHRISVTNGTVMHRSKQSLRTWFYGAFLVSTLTPGISALQFQRQLGITRYETAFQLLHKLRSALVDPERSSLSGEVEVDEAYVGGVEEGRPGRGAVTKSIILLGVEVVTYEALGKDRETMVTKIRAGRVRISVIPNLTADTLVPWVQQNVKVGTKVLTDGNASYNALASLGYGHEKVFASHKRVSTGQYLPLVHLVIVNLKTWLRGTHKGAVRAQHLQAYLNEFTFRFNRRYWRGPAFLRVLGLSVSAKDWPEYETLYDAGAVDGWVHPDPRAAL
jgi:transposase-like protein